MEWLDIQENSIFLLSMFDSQYIPFVLECVSGEGWMEGILLFMEINKKYFGHGNHMTVREFSNLMLAYFGPIQNYPSIKEIASCELVDAFRKLTTSAIPFNAPLSLMSICLWDYIQRMKKRLTTGPSWIAMRKQVTTSVRVEMLTVLTDPKLRMYFSSFICPNSLDTTALSCWVDIRTQLRCLDEFRIIAPTSDQASKASSWRPSFSSASMNTSVCASVSEPEIVTVPIYSDTAQVLGVLLRGLRNISAKYFKSTFGVGHAAAGSEDEKCSRYCGGVSEVLRLDIAALIQATATVRLSDVASLDQTYVNTTIDKCLKIYHSLERQIFQHLQLLFPDFVEISVQYAEMAAYMQLRDMPAVTEAWRRLELITGRVSREGRVLWSHPESLGDTFVKFANNRSVDESSLTGLASMQLGRSVGWSSLGPALSGSAVFPCDLCCPVVTIVSVIASDLTVSRTRGWANHHCEINNKQRNNQTSEFESETYTALEQLHLRLPELVDYFMHICEVGYGIFEQLFDDSTDDDSDISFTHFFHARGDSLKMLMMRDVVTVLTLGYQDDNKFNMSNFNLLAVCSFASKGQSSAGDSEGLRVLIHDKSLQFCVSIACIEGAQLEQLHAVNRIALASLTCGVIPSANSNGTDNNPACVSTPSMTSQTSKAISLQDLYYGGARYAAAADDSTEPEPSTSACPNKWPQCQLAAETHLGSHNINLHAVVTNIGLRLTVQLLMVLLTGHSVQLVSEEQVVLHNAIIALNQLAWPFRLCRTHCQLQVVTESELRLWWRSRARDSSGSPLYSPEVINCSDCHLPPLPSHGHTQHDAPAAATSYDCGDLHLVGVLCDVWLDLCDAEKEDILLSGHLLVVDIDSGQVMSRYDPTISKSKLFDPHIFKQYNSLAFSVLMATWQHSSGNDNSCRQAMTTFWNEIFMKELPRFMRHYPAHSVISCDVKQLLAALLSPTASRAMIAGTSTTRSHTSCSNNSTPRTEMDMDDRDSIQSMFCSELILLSSPAFLDLLEVHGHIIDNLAF